jgi:predicted transcriptional regulator
MFNMPRPARDAQLGIRLPTQLKRRLQRVADKCNESLATFVIRVVTVEVIKIEDAQRQGTP